MVGMCGYITQTLDYYQSTFKIIADSIFVESFISGKHQMSYFKHQLLTLKMAMYEVYIADEDNEIFYIM